MVLLASSPAITMSRAVTSATTGSTAAKRRGDRSDKNECLRSPTRART